MGLLRDTGFVHIYIIHRYKHSVLLTYQKLEFRTQHHYLAADVHYFDHHYQTVFQ